MDTTKKIFHQDSEVDKNCFIYAMTKKQRKLSPLVQHLDDEQIKQSVIRKYVIEMSRFKNRIFVNVKEEAMKDLINESREHLFVREITQANIEYLYNFKYAFFWQVIRDKERNYSHQEFIEINDYEINNNNIHTSSEEIIFTYIFLF